MSEELETAIDQSADERLFMATLPLLGIALLLAVVGLALKSEPITATGALLFGLVAFVRRLS